MINNTQTSFILTVNLGHSRYNLTQNLSTPGYGVVHSEARIINFWRVIEQKKFIDICKKSVQAQKYIATNTPSAI